MNRGKGGEFLKVVTFFAGSLCAYVDLDWIFFQSIEKKGGDNHNGGRW